MKTVLQLLRTFMAIVPLQRWINWIAVLLLAGAAVALLSGRGNGALGFTIFAVVLLALVPALFGGVALRYGSTRDVLHVKPNGRRSMLIAASLAVTLLALLVTLPFWVDQWLGLQRSGVRRIDPLHVFPIVWTGLIVLWVGIFAISHSMFAFSLIGLFPIAAMALARFMGPHLPHPAWLLLPGAALWLGFVAWYLRTGSISRPHLTPAGHSLDGGSFSPLMWLYERMAPGRELSRRGAQHMHLFGGPRSLFAVAGAWVALIFLVVHQFVLWINSEPARPPRGPGHLLFMLPFLGFFLFSLGFATVRRARYLWLRERCDRTTLFGLAERLGLGASLTCWGVTAAIVLAISLAREPGRSHLAASYVIAHGAFSVCLFYGGMAMTRGWAVRDVLLAVVIGLWFFVQLNLLKPLPEATTSTAWVMTLAALLFAALLRWYAARQWRTLDWRIAMPPRPVARSNA